MVVALTSENNPIAAADREWFGKRCERAGVAPSDTVEYEFVARMGRGLPREYRTDEHTIQSMRNKIFREVEWAL